MQEERSAEPVASQNTATGSVGNISLLTKPEVGSGGENTKEWEYEFSTCADGRAMFIGLWDTSDVSACERLMHRPMTADEIAYSKETGNGFCEDKYGNRYTFFKREVIERSYSRPDPGDMREEETPTKTGRSVMDILASI
jgi:hypothetical protein